MKYVYAFEEGSQGAEVPARRQGRQPRRDDEPRPARAARLHDHRPTRARPTWPPATRCPTASWTRSPPRSPRSRRRWASSSATPTDPLLVSVRSGAPFSMPGMMDTVLNLGLNDESVSGLAKQTNNERFAYDSYRRFVQMFGKIVLDVAGDAVRGGAARPRRGAGRRRRHRAVAPTTSQGLVETFKEIVLAGGGRRRSRSDPHGAARLRDRSGVQVVERRARA